MSRADLIESIQSYQTPFNEELKFKSIFLDLLKDSNCFVRDRLEGHLTASCWVTNVSLKRILLLHHKKLERWLQPGGHADGEENLLNVAKKELQEETGLKNFSLKTSEIFDIDIHTIPEKKNIPKHFHYDVRFHFVSNDPNEIKGNHESFDLKWVDIEEVADLCNHEKSILRMVEKTKTLLAD